MKMSEMNAGDKFKDGNNEYMVITDVWDDPCGGLPVKCVCLDNGNTVRFANLEIEDGT